MKINYGGWTILTDPMLGKKGDYDPFIGNGRNPTVDMPFTNEEMLQGVDGVVVTHYHPDHLGIAAIQALPKESPVFCQPGDEDKIEKDGFQSVTPIDNTHTWEGITLTRTGGMHGQGKILELTGQVSGFVLQADGEPTVYWAGYSIWCDEVEQAVKTYKPDVIITHSGVAHFPGQGYIIMDGEQTITTAEAAPDAVVVAVHMESLDHCPVTRDELRQMADKAGLTPSRLMIPNDGEIIAFGE